MTHDHDLHADAAARLGTARAGAEEVAAMALDVYQTTRLTIERKPDGSVVTPVDRGGETAIRTLIRAAFPDDAILGEEHPNQDGRSGWRWVIDPIDGTRSFTLGIPSFCTLIGIEYEGRALAGLATFPALGESVEAVVGGGAWWTTRAGERRAARVANPVPAVDRATIELGAASSFHRAGHGERRPVVVDAVSRTRGWDDGYAFALVATGRVPGAVQCGLSRWDVCPFVPIMAEAGGVITSWSGAPVLDGDGDVVAGPKALVDQLRDVLAES